jgi:Plasmid encoded RepA protein
MLSEQPKKRGKLLQMPKQRTVLQKRLLDAAELLRDGDPEVTFQHSIFCQTVLPYRDPGDGVRSWERLNGHAHLKVLAGEAMHPEKGRFIEIGLPFGPKPRLILCHLNAEAVRTGSPEIEIEATLTAFVKRLGLDPTGRNLGTIRDQLTRLAAASIRLGMVCGGRGVTFNTQIVTEFEIWASDERQRALWPSTVSLSPTYFESLQRHAVPLDERALRFLAHSAMALDLYAWMAQRLHRIPKPHRTLVPWVSLHDQFGQGYASLRKFRQVFLHTLRQVHLVYPAAKLEVNGQGLLLYTSPPPVAKTGMVVQLPAPSAH